MNATKWETLSNFVKYLGKSGQAIVDETEKGWFIAWIDRDPAALARQAQLAKKRKHDMDDEERHRRELKRRVKAGGADDHDEASELAADRAQVKTAVVKSSGATAPKPLARAAAFRGDSDEDAPAAAPAKKPSNLDAIMLAGQEKKAPVAARADHWLHAGIVVKCVNKKVGGGAYYKKKGTVRRVVDGGFAAEVAMADSRDVLQLDQDDLETVIPAVGRRVCVVNGRGRGATGVLLGIDVEDFSVSVEVDAGPDKGAVLRRVDYEDVSRLAS